MSDPGAPFRQVRVERRPERIGRYRILDRIGKGAMGVVYAAQDERMGREVALKVLMADLDGDPDMRARFFREAQVAAKLVHKNVVTIFDLGEEDGRLFIVMELLRGDTLHDYLRQHTLELEDKVDLTIQICDGLSVASAAGIFHRDVKPGNLFIQRDGPLKILDFGIARLASSNMTASGFIVGTPDYMSPEQARGEEVDARSDQFSVGAVLYFMLSGRKPFFAPNLPAILHKVVSEEPPPLSDHEAPPALARIVSRALAKDPAARYRDFPEMLAELSAFRRRYDAETQALATAASSDFRNVHRLFDEWRETAATLGIPAPDTRSCFAEYVDAVPALVEKPPDSLASVVLRRSGVQPVALRLEQLRLSVGARVSHLRSAQLELEQAMQTVARGDSRKALGCLEDLARRFPDAAIVSKQVSLCRATVGDDQAREDRAEALLVQSAEERSRGRLNPALALAEEAATLIPQSRQASQLVTALREQIARLQAERRQRVDRCLERATRALRKGRFAEVEELLQYARNEEPGNRDAARVASGVAAARAARDAADSRAREVAERTAHARRLFDEGQHAAAIAALEALSVEHPEARAVVAELERQRSESLRIAREQRAAEEADGLAESAEAAWAAGDAPKALCLAGQVLAAQRTHERALRLVAVAKARVREMAEREERITRAADHVKRAKGFVERRRFDRAVGEAEHAMALDPAGQEAPAVLAEASRLREAENAAREHAQELARRARLVRTTLADARAAIRAQDFARADALAQKALALDPQNHETRATLESVLASRAAVAAQQDDTVDLLMSAPDPDDTAAIAIAPRDVGFVSVLWAAVGSVRRRVTASLLTNVMSKHRGGSPSSAKPPASVRRTR
jgi:serine/threonine-protein kinase